ncbi:alpha/beta fold hydrolase [Oceanicoccus sp. KOV_DT_Chl]|uniref:alpha/beta fold hydrolase n=1 Tax=Oceanicoccus sp. KOV_DT_Chl TaxID=1904639 RepID=UPI000C7DDAB8|nr:alpha/beta hydrolase [Oceanicoccus sp. KOV_DT_Chl]
MKEIADDTEQATRPLTAGFSLREKARREARPTEGKMALYKSEHGFNEIMDWYEGLVDKINIPFNSRFVNTRFGRTHMLVCGAEDATPLILVQAAAGSAPLWRNQLPAFAKHFRVYALDTVGQPGLSDPTPPSYLNNDYVDWLTDVIDDLHIEKAHFIGVSAGGWQVMQMAIQKPERVNKLIMLSPMGISHARLPIKIWLTKVLRKSKDVDSLEKDLTAKSVTSKSPGGSFGTFDRQLARAMALCTRHFRLDRSLGVYGENSNKISFIKALKVLRKFFLSEPKSLLRKMQSEALVVFGEHEVLYNPYKVAKRAEKLMPNTRAEVLSGAGHAVIYDQVEQANTMIVDFLNK